MRTIEYIRIGIVACWMVYGITLWLICMFVFDRVAIAEVYGWRVVLNGQVAVTWVQKPSTVRFSDGHTADVGSWPSSAVTVLWLIVVIGGPLLVLHVGNRYFFPWWRQRRMTHTG